MMTTMQQMSDVPFSTKHRQGSPMVEAWCGQLTFKGFHANLQCRSFQYAVGPLHWLDTAEIAVSVSGFHSCFKPLDVLRFYPPGMSRYFLVQPSGRIAKGTCGIEQASQGIRLIREFTLPEFIDMAMSKTSNAALETMVSAHANDSLAGSELKGAVSCNIGHCSAAANTGDDAVARNDGHRGAACTTGDQSVAASAGHHALAANTGNRSAASAQGPQSIASNSGHYGIAHTAGEASIAANTGCHALAICTGPASIAVTTAEHSTAYAEDTDSIALADGRGSKAKASAGAALILIHRGAHNELIHIRSGIAGKDLKADVWYTLDAAGEFIEVQ